MTFLAFGNGAPDIFSAIAAIGNAKDGDAGLAFGALFGKCYSVFPLSSQPQFSIPLRAIVAY